MAEVVSARNDVYNALARFQNDLIEHVDHLKDEIVDVELLHQIRDLLNNCMDALDANVLLHPDNPAEIPISDDAPHASDRSED